MKAALYGDVLKSVPEWREDLESLVVYDDYGNPILAVKRLAEGRLAVTKAGDEDFQAVLKSFGIGKIPEVLHKEVARR